MSVRPRALLILMATVCLMLPAVVQAVDIISLHPLAGEIIGQRSFQITVNMSNPAPRSGLQLAIGFDPALVTPDTMQTTSRTQSHITGAGFGTIDDSTAVLLLLDLSGAGMIATGAGPVAQLSFHLTPEGIAGNSSPGSIQLRFHIREFVLANAASAPVDYVLTEDLLYVWAISDVPDPAERFPGLILRQNLPNPFKATTVIEYDLTEATAVRLEVFDASGRLVRTLLDESQSAGRHEATWAGITQDGTTAVPGVYLYRLMTPKATRVRKMVFLQ